MGSDLNGKRAKVGSSGTELVDQFPRRGQGETVGGGMPRASIEMVGGGMARSSFERDGGGSARGTDIESEAQAMFNANDDAFVDGEVSRKEKKHKHREKKEKKHKKREHSEDVMLLDGSDERGVLERQNLNHSQSEPATLSKPITREAAPPPEAHEACGLGGGSYPAGVDQKLRPKAGLKLAPLQSGGGSAGCMSMPSASSGLHASSSVPELKPMGAPHQELKPMGAFELNELKPMEKLQPLGP